LGGEPHRDDTRAGTFTLLYYPNPEWKSGWDGETVFYEQSGEIAFSVLLRPNRAVFFDSRILHAGRAPSRICTALRVSVAYKLEAAIAPPRPRMEDAGQIHAVRAAGPSEGLETLQVDGAKRLYRARIAETEVLRAVEDRLTELAVRLRLPGFRPGRIPNSVLHQRYGAQARAAVLKRLAVGVALRELPAGSVASACDLLAGAESGEMVIALAATHLPDLPELDYSALKISRIVVVDGDPSPEEAAFARDHWKSQVLDRLDAAYPIPLFPGLIDRELAAILKVAESSGSIPGGAEERQALEAEFRKIAERRLRLGVVVTELARRLGMQAADGAGLEDRVLERLAEQAAVTELRMAAKDLREMMAS
jgi:hypothetical protein